MEFIFFFFFQAEDGIRDTSVTGVQTCALPISQAGMYTTSGAGYRNVNQGPQKVYLCPCGEIMIPPNYASGVPAGSERDLFVQSLKLAIARRNSTTLDQVAQGTVSL